MSGTSSPMGARRAVQYLRMSTEHQKYSLENQSAAIAEYAALEGYEVIRTYSDAGKSGLHLQGRRQLQQLLSDCLSPDRDFDAILVLDVSRWGRFQDPDQAAYYEYVCRGAGVRVAYAGETFDNDGGLVSSIVKHIKRVMAAEYSRELSEKVTRAKLQQARLGYRQGGSVAYGFRRQLEEDGGRARRLLARGEVKAIHSDRVRTVPGPPEEQAVIRRMFRLYVRDGGSFAKVARQLNAEGVPTNTGRPWGSRRIRNLIRNEICVGVYTYNKTNRLMRKAATRRPSEDWIRVAVTKPTVSKAMFRRANHLANGGRHRYSERELLRHLTRLVKRHGHVTPAILEADRRAPGYMTYVQRFGSFKEACARMGHDYQGRLKWRPAIQGVWTDAAILGAVRRCYEERGAVSAAILSSDPQFPSANLIQIRFGGLIPCYEKAGVPLTTEQLRAKRWKAAQPGRPLVPDGLPLGPILAALVRDHAGTD